MAQDLYKTLAYLNGREGMTIIMVTHDLKAALKSARTVLHIGRQRGLAPPNIWPPPWDVISRRSSCESFGNGFLALYVVGSDCYSLYGYSSDWEK